MIKFSEDMLALLRKPSTCYLATTMADGSPQITQTWVDTDGENVIINSVQGYVKLKNIARDPRVAVALSSPDNPTRYFQIRGRVIKTTTDGAAEHIEILAQKYTALPLVRRAQPGACDHRDRTRKSHQHGMTCAFSGKVCFRAGLLQNHEQVYIKKYEW